MIKIKGRIRNEYKNIFDDNNLNEVRAKVISYKVETYFSQKTFEVFNEHKNDDSEVVIRRTKKWR